MAGHDCITQMRIQPISLLQAVTLRMRELDPPRTWEQAVSVGDQALDAEHIGAVLEGQVIGSVSLGSEPIPLPPFPPAWRLRGLVVASEYRGLGVGRSLVKAAKAKIDASHKPVWFYARQRLTSLYASEGFLRTDITVTHALAGEVFLFLNQSAVDVLRANGVNRSAEGV